MKIKHSWTGLLVSGLLSGVLSSCSLPIKSQRPVEQVYRLSPTVTPLNSSQPAKINLYLPPLSINPALDNSNIMLASAGNRLDFIADSRWPDKLSDYLRAVIIDGLTMSNAFQSVSERMLGREDNYRLLLRVTDFQAELPDTFKSAAANDQQDTATVVISLEAFLLRVQDQRLIGKYRYKKQTAGILIKTSKIVAAFEKTLNEILQELAIELGSATLANK